MRDLRWLRDCSSLVLALALFCLHSSASRAASDEPEWVKGYGKSSAYPRDRYITGFGCSQDEDLERGMKAAQAGARSDLAAFFHTRLSSLLVSREEQSGDVASQYVKSNIAAFSKLQLLGVRIESYVDRTAKRACALAVMDIPETRRIYGDKSQRVRGEIASQVRVAQEAEGHGKVSEAVQSYLASYPLFASLEEVEAVLLVLGGSVSGPSTAAATGVPDRASVSSAVERLLNQKCSSVDDLASVLAFRLSPQIGSRPVTVAPFTYADTEFTSQFSRYLCESLGVRLSSLKIPASASEGVRTRSQDAETPSASTPGSLVVTGSYLEKGEDLKTFAIVTDKATGERIGAGDSSVPLSALAKEGLASKPSNFTEALADQRVFSRNELVGSGLNVEAWTSKGDRNLAIRQGEQYRVFLRVTQPCYVRMVYHLSSGQRVLVPILGEEQYFVDAGKVNKAVEMPETYEVVPPFGVEVLQVFASTTPFPSPPVETRTIEGENYKVLKVNSEKDLEEAVVTMRGIRVVPPAGSEKPLVAEARITLTTMR